MLFGNTFNRFSMDHSLATIISHRTSPLGHGFIPWLSVIVGTILDRLSLVPILILSIAMVTITSAAAPITSSIFSPRRAVRRSAAVTCTLVRVLVTISVVVAIVSVIVWERAAGTWAI